MTEFTLVGLRVVQQVAVSGSFTQAAELLGYTQSAVSRQVAAMEAAAGAPIFERGRRGVKLTAAGEVLIRRATSILADVTATGQELAGLRDRLAGRLTVGSFPAAAMALVPRALARLRATHPGLAVQFVEASTPALLRQLRAKRLDVAVIGVGHGLPDYDLADLHRTTVRSGSLLVAVGEQHRLADRRELTVADLEDEPWIVGAGAAGEPQFGAWPTLSEPTVAHSTRNWSTRLGLVAAGLGLTVVPDLAVPALPGGVRTIPVTGSRQSGRATVAVTRVQPSARARALVSALRDEAAP
ncbi:LysR family transcriptional regulator [Actinoplanes sp. HUAS TT8]|uniref:LysR family transcriptional regulator n=1 Tax=Actinoplanes sp. HUAS TT8 TaxID=3447453 RepID=UPI003F5230FD